jgi:NAD(P)-dependent dehydrogenase (short-subunit alcohol dehydrogenase family)
MAFETTTDDVIAGVDLSGRTALVTGATTGLGLETARTLAGAGARVIVGSRTVEKGDTAVAAIRALVPDADLSHVQMDLADLASVRACTDQVAGQTDALHLLINNAGVMFTPEGRTADGHETQFGTNHLGHFVLTNRLVPLLLAGAPSRVVNLSSGAHTISDVIWDDPDFRDRPYDKFDAYGQSKTANLLFAVELDRRLRERGVRVNAVHPGMIMTELARFMAPEDLEELGKRAARNAEAGDSAGMPEFKTIPQGAATSVWAAVAPELADVGGTYLADAEIRTDEARSYALDVDAAVRLWALSEELVGETYAT